MASQIPELWIGYEVTVLHTNGSAQTGTLRSLDHRGIVVLTEIEGEDEDLIAWYPLSSVVRISRGQRKRGEVHSF
ncbi:MAG: hypothetical protein M3R38_16445 [Actinomycetota bacterium]|nr:hypothetical protein [Actinomycetota bacterium]